ncbi:BTAD domain-containing putative transcriptional regulator [Amycolatopsis endophytica]|uniref:DNA-binding SARP family transcriptional activator/tetratricopeptide (TPR) repeat protein n=1 Tax=Amycolatopsis endophytica TaxID=860233 RepID=A0A853B3P3_9PSEU|nr:AfsR/SARP family transcriptional regulator [Amycolatopsis endophytica]NYI89445.1 DNA-binding SARP family transcriptional activator/tetratricopeptide (TPR) repeat protein [Amycolatopsis endophytica]
MADDRLRLSVLGPLRAWRGTRQLDLGPTRQRALLAALVLRPGRTVSADELLDDVWGLEPPGTGRRVIPTYVFRLRKCLRATEDAPADAVIARGSSGYRFADTTAEVDAASMERLAAEAAAAERSGDLIAAVRAASAALDTFRGEPLTGLPGPFAEGHRLRLAERRIALQLDRAAWQLRLGRHREVVDELAALTGIHPHHEALAALLMRALHGAGRRADALAVYTTLRRRLVDDLGVEPGREPRRVHQAVLRGEDEALGVPVRWERKPRNELPADGGELAGREAELARLAEAGDPAVVTVVAVDGVPGAGKSALAVRAAHRLRSGHPDGCLFIDLYGHTEGHEPLRPDQALPRLLRAIGVDGAHTADVDELAASWRSATASLRLLLLLDNAKSAAQVRPLLPSGPGSRVLVTSRQRLTGLSADRRVSLDALEPEAAHGLLRRVVGADRVDDEPVAARELARLCGGLPLALRIAAARLQNRPTWTFGYLVARLADDERRLGELTAEDHGVEAALRLSYRQLPEGEQRTFRMLGLVPTPEFEPLAVAAILGCSAAEAERSLENLVDASLLLQPAGGRYRLHDLLGVYARRLASGEPHDVIAAARGRVLRLYAVAARLASDWGVHDPATGPSMADAPFADWTEATAWLDAVGGDLTEVVGYAARAGEADYVCWIAEGLVEYLIRQGRYEECRTGIGLALPLAEASTDRRMRAALRRGFGVAEGMQGRYESGRPWCEEALRISREVGDRHEEARALAMMGTLDSVTGEAERALAVLREANTLGRSLDDPYIVGMSIANTGMVHARMGRIEEARSFLEQGVVFAENINRPRPIAMALGSLGKFLLGLGEHGDAVPLLRRAARAAEESGDIDLNADCLSLWGAAESGLGNVETAVGLQRRAFGLLSEHTRPQLELAIRNRLAAGLFAAGDVAGAREQFRVVLARTEASGHHTERAWALAGVRAC